MDHHRSYSYAYGSTPQKQQTAQHTSSAFSANANPNEDWTKISDLAERRRIQNRIAQRNYRKKLKKRLEDLERRAASSSSPETKHEELDMSESLSNIPIISNAASRRRPRSGTGCSSQSSICEQSPPTLDDKGMFSRQHTRQLSASPPPFSYASQSVYDLSAAHSVPQVAPLSPPYLSSDHPPYSSYVQPPPSARSSQWQRRTSTVQQGLYGEDEMSPFSMSFANLAGSEAPYSGGGYQDHTMIQTPDLSDGYEYFMESSPEYFGSHPLSPDVLPLTPPQHFYDGC